MIEQGDLVLAIGLASVCFSLFLLYGGHLAAFQNKEQIAGSIAFLGILFAICVDMLVFSMYSLPPKKRHPLKRYP